MTDSELLDVLDALLDADEETRATRLAAMRLEHPDHAALLERWLAADSKSDHRVERNRYAGLGDDRGIEPGLRLGPYRLLREIGRGGMGTVWLAERADGEFEQQVAVKLIKRGMDTDAVLARFRAERQILARLDHPNIARLLDGGVADGGQPYFAMEYVAGEALLDHVQRMQPDLRAALALFLKLCHAVAYAHTRLVVHRDLKPSNVIVAPDGEPKLLDFGIAKVIDDTGANARTQTGVRYFTRAYSAPEQVSGDPISTATDVYALGVILREMLTGTSASGAGGAPLPQAFERLDAARSRAAQFGSARIRPQDLGSDLDLIVRKSLADEPSRRYTGAQALAEDLERFLEGRPVSARPDSTSYRARTFVRRNRMAVTAASLILLTLVLGLGAALWQAQRAAVAARQSRLFSSFVSEVLRASEPARARGREVTARDLLDQSVGRIDTDLSSDPVVQAEILALIGEVYMNLSELERADPLITRAIVAARSLHGEDSREYLRVLTIVADLRYRQGRYPEMTHLLQQISAGLERHGPTADLDRAAILVRQSRLANKTGHREHGLKLARSAVELARRAGESSEIYRNALFAYGYSLHWRNDYKGAEAAYRELHSRLLAAHGVNHPKTIGHLHSLGSLLSDAGRYAEAEPLLREGLAGSRAVLGERSESAVGFAAELGLVLELLGRTAESEPLLRTGRADGRRYLGANHPTAAYNALHLASTLAARGKLLEAASFNREALAAYELRQGAGNGLWVQAKGQLAVALREHGQYEAAIRLLRECIDAYRALASGSDLHGALLNAHLALAHAAADDIPSAEVLAAPALRVLTDKVGPDHPFTWIAERAVAKVELARGRKAKGQMLLRTLADKQARQFGPTDFRVGVARWEYAQSISESAERVAIEQEAVRVLAANPEADHPLAVMARQRLNMHRDDHSRERD